MDASTVTQQLDYLLFIASLSCPLLMLVCLHLRQTDGERFGWGRLALFWLLQWLYQASEFLGHVLGDYPLLCAAGYLCKVAGLLVLLDMVRVAGIGRWHRGLLVGMLIPIILLITWDIHAGWIAAHVRMHYAQCLTLGATLLPLLIRHRAHHAPRDGMLTGAIVCLALWAAVDAIAVQWTHGFHTENDNPTTWINLTSLPVQLVQGLLTALLASFLWRHSCGTACARNLVVSDDLRCPRRLALAVLGILAGGWIAAAAAGNYQDQSMRRHLLTRTRLASAALDAIDLSRLSGTESDIGTRVYDELKAELGRLRVANHDCRFLYLVAAQGNDIVFMADSEPADSEDCSPAGQLYEEASDGLVRFFIVPTDFVEGPHTDRWGTWISGFVPLTHPDTGRLLAGVGMDIDASNWQKNLYLARLPMISVTLLILMIVAGFSVTQQRSRTASRRITESECRLKTIFDSIQAGLLVIDAESHTIIDANPTALAMIGADREQVLRKVCHNFVCPAERNRCPVTDLQQTVDNSERILVKANGDRIAILKTVVPVHIHGRLHLLESFIDITARKQAEAELQAHRERLEELVSERTAKLVEAERQVLQGEKLASVGQLAAGISHEINTPIQYIGDNLKAIKDNFNELAQLEKEYRALVELIKSGSDPAEQLRAIEVTAENCDLEYILEDTPQAINQGLEGVARVAGIVRAMKTFSHIDHAEMTQVDINQCLQSTLTVAKNEYKYVADVETNLGQLPMIECYGGEINQVFLNMVVNAAHAIADTGQRGKITVRTRLVDDQVEIAISDTGTGIPEKARSKIFEPFFTTKTVGKGTGQGLAISHQIVVRKHRGSLTFETEIGKGTTFLIRLPAKREPESQPAGDSQPVTA